MDIYCYCNIIDFDIEATRAVKISNEVVQGCFFFLPKHLNLSKNSLVSHGILDFPLKINDMRALQFLRIISRQQFKNIPSVNYPWRERISRMLERYVTLHVCFANLNYLFCPRDMANEKKKLFTKLQFAKIFPFRFHVRIQLPNLKYWPHWPITFRKQWICWYFLAFESALIMDRVVGEGRGRGRQTNIDVSRANNLKWINFSCGFLLLCSCL